MDNPAICPESRRVRLEEQGFRGLSDTNLESQKFGIRFPYFVCGTLVLIGLILKSIPLLLVMLAIAALGMLPPRHPIDYLYNGIVRHLLGKPKVVPRAPQGRFACAIATLLLGGTVYCFSLGLNIVAYVLGGILLTSAALVSFLDICIPSKIYNLLFERRDSSKTTKPDSI
jgi:hypothetical protein